MKVFGFFYVYCNLDCAGPIVKSLFCMFSYC